MIKNIIFDMGQVLIKFEPKKFIEDIGITNSDDIDLLIKEVYKSIEWIQMDRGALTCKQGSEQICKRIPERLHNSVRKLTYDWDRPMMPVEGMADLIKELKQSNYNIYLLSNANERQENYWHNIPGSEYFGGKLVSYEVKCLKPEKEIYDIMLKRFDLKADECLFIDDSAANCEAAANQGIKSIIFLGDVNELKDKLKQLNIIK